MNTNLGSLSSSAEELNSTPSSNVAVMSKHCQSGPSAVLNVIVFTGLHQCSSPAVHQAAPPEVPERSSPGMQTGAQAGMQTGAQAAVHTRLRLRGLRTANLCRTPLSQQRCQPSTFTSTPTSTSSSLSATLTQYLKKLIILNYSPFTANTPQPIYFLMFYYLFSPKNFFTRCR